MFFRALLWRARLVVPIILLAIASQLTAQNSDRQPLLNRFDPSLMDRSVDPCLDFYKFVCGKWLAANPVPQSESLWNTRSDLQLWNWMIVRRVMEGAARPDRNRTSLEQKIGDYWYACMNEPAIEAEGKEPIRDELTFIDSLASKHQLAEAVAKLHLELPGATVGNVNQTTAVLFGITRGQDPNDPITILATWDQGGLGMPNRDFYLRDDEKSSEIRKHYVAHVEKMFELAGIDAKTSSSNADVVLAMETELARGQMDATSRRNIQELVRPVPMADLKALAPSFDFDRYLTLIAAADTKDNLVYAPEFFRAVHKLIEAESLEHWKIYLKWWVLHAGANYLPKAFAEESFSFYGRVIQGAKEPLPRWQTCVNSADRDLGEAVGQAYVKQAFALASKQRMEAMVASVRQAMAEDIRHLDWMSEPTKKEALRKLDAMSQKIGYPDKWRDYSALEIRRDSYVRNVRRAAAFELHRQVAMFGKAIDPAEWYITVPTVDAHFYPQLNEIAFPAGILQPPLFDPAQDDAVNYGAIGMVIGHEITHNFDTRGRHFDEIGRLRDWWTPADAEKYNARGQCFVSEYTQEIPDLGVKTNGTFTEAEDIADNGGLRLALMALESTYAKEGRSLDQKGPDGWTALERFFLADAFNWCENTRPEMARTWVLTNGHSLPRFRAINVVANFPEFREAFGCAKSKPMVRQNACRVW